MFELQRPPVQVEPFLQLINDLFPLSLQLQIYAVFCVNGLFLFSDFTSAVADLQTSAIERQTTNTLSSSEIPTTDFEVFECRRLRIERGDAH